MKRSRRWEFSLVLLQALFAAMIYGKDLTLMEQTPQAARTTLTVDGTSPSQVFDSYLVSLQGRNPFTEAGPVDVKIDASLPGLSKRASMLAVRETNACERSEYNGIRSEGDAMVKQQVIARYLAAQEQAEGLPYSSVAVTPANYKFRYRGSIETSGAPLYVFQIAPKEKRAGLIRGEIWIDSETGLAVHQEGRFVKRPSVFIRQIDVTRDTNLRDGVPYIRITHLAIDTHMVGRAELTILERAAPADDLDALQVAGLKNAR